ncbi:unnamed protein product [Cylicocyclus nassatus]|uniref:Uncharacterized protein n=1 Tax=Cylicocyclus nassatus TaxID=53992 RepID=A0AA36HIK3_CYLNA|nr:unnamed protein product [Cylicocyclus nassatus]
MSGCSSFHASGVIRVIQNRRRSSKKVLGTPETKRKSCMRLSDGVDRKRKHRCSPSQSTGQLLVLRKRNDRAATKPKLGHVVKNGDLAKRTQFTERSVNCFIV